LAGPVKGFTIGFNRFVSALQADETEIKAMVSKPALPVHCMSKPFRLVENGFSVVEM